MAQHGTLLALLSADCPKRQAGKMHDVCGAHMPQLPPAPGDLRGKATRCSGAQ
jgi:hypothetical protein